MQAKAGIIDLPIHRGEAETDFGPVADDGPSTLPAGTQLLLGQYTITDYLNCGGFGITYLAADSLGRTIAVKECFPSQMCYRAGRRVMARSARHAAELAAIVRNFVTEAHCLANARHDNIVHVHQIFEENGTAYMAMDFVDGPDLLEIVAKDPRRFSPKEVILLTGKMLGAIRFVHDRGMLHRDISPDNILIRPDGEPVLIDFGSARERVPGRAYSKLKFVKDGYSPQEFYVASGEQGTWSDLYSLAASIRHLITGEVPVDAQARLAALAAREPDPLKPLAGSVVGYPARFLRALDKAMEVLPEKRLRTAEDWLTRITNRISSTELAARPLAMAADRFSGNALSGSVLRVGAEARAVAIGVIVCGVTIAGLAIWPHLGRTDGGVPPATAFVPPVMTAPVIEVAASADGAVDEIAFPETPGESLASLLAFRPAPMPVGPVPAGQASVPRLTIAAPEIAVSDTSASARPLFALRRTASVVRTARPAALPEAAAIPVVLHIDDPRRPSALSALTAPTDPDLRERVAAVQVAPAVPPTRTDPDTLHEVTIEPVVYRLNVP